MLTKRVTINNEIGLNQNWNVLSFKNESKLMDRTMNHYQKLICRINELIRDKAQRDDVRWCLEFNDLDEDEQGELVVLHLEYDDRDTYDCFHQADRYAKDDEITCALIKLLKDNSPDTRENFAEAIRHQSVRRYKNRLQNLIDERCGWEQSEWESSGSYEE